MVSMFSRRDCLKCLQNGARASHRSVANIIAIKISHADSLGGNGFIGSHVLDLLLNRG